jgi:hypothetical protein
MWQVRVREYGSSPLPLFQMIHNKYVTPDVLAKVDEALKKMNIPVHVFCTAGGWKYAFFNRPPNMHELDVASGNLIQEDDEIDYTDPFWKLNKHAKRRVFTLITDSWKNICVVEVDVDEGDAAHGGRLYLSFEGNRSKPFEMTIPGVSRVDANSVDIFTYCQLPKDKDCTDKIVIVRVHDLNGEVLSLNIGTLGRLFKFRTI